MDELWSNTTLRIATIAFVLFVIVGTVLIFVVPDDASSPGDTLEGVPTISIANQTSIAAFNATSLAGTSTPDARSAATVPKQTTHAARALLPSRTFTGGAAVDATLNLLVSSSRYDVVNDLGQAEIPCGTASTTCDGAPPGTVIGYFIAISCGTGFVRDPATAQAFVTHALDKHPAWDVGAVMQEGIAGITTDGFAVGLRAAAGNTGDLWYLNEAGEVIGLDAGCGHPGWGGVAPDPDYPDAPVLYCSDVGVRCPTETQP